MGAGSPGARGRGALRPRERRPIPAWDEAHALAPGQGAPAMHLRAAWGRASSGKARCRHARAAPMKPGEAIEIAGVRLSSPDKILYPEQGLTKRDLANYYLVLADW